MVVAGFDLAGNFGGELAALGAAFLWASASVLYGRIGRYLSPPKMNLLKNLIALILILGILLPGGDLITGIDRFAMLLLLVSGAIGIGMGDSLYFGALKHIGARRSLLIMALSPPITGIIAAVFLDEGLPAGAWLGVWLTVAGVAWVITERDTGPDCGNSPKTLGATLAVLASAGQAAGAVLSHAAFLHMNISPLRSALLRLTGGIVGAFIFMPLFRKTDGHGFRNLNSTRRWLTVLFTVFIGTFMGIWLQQVSLKHTAAGVAQTLFATSPLFVLPIVVLMGEKVNIRAVLGVLLAIAGVGFLFGFQSP
jgi:drug/metabolite transporter (DMT)-like permease